MANTHKQRAVAWWILGIHCHQANRHLEFTVDIICLRDICIRIPPFWSVLLDPKVLNQWSRNQVAPSTLSAWSAWGSLETDDSTCHYLVFNDVLMVIRWPTWTRCTILTWLASELSWQFLWSTNPTTTVLCFHWTGTEGACWGASLACSEWLTRQLSLACNVWGNQETPWDKPIAILQETAESGTNTLVQETAIVINATAVWGSPWKTWPSPAHPRAQVMPMLMQKPLRRRRRLKLSGETAPSKSLFWCL